MDDRPLDARQLRYFLAIVDHGGVTRAAKELQVAQPSVSQAIRALERDVGAELFHRVGRQLVLTTAGNALIAPARRALRDLSTARASVAHVQEEMGGRLDVVALPTLAHEVVRRSAEFRRRFPAVALRILDAETPAALVGLVTTGRCDLGLVHLPLKACRLETIDLAVEQLLVVLPPGSAVRANGPLPLAELVDLPFIVGPAGTATRALLDGVMADLGAKATIAMETSLREAIVPLVLAGAGAALLPAAQAEEAGHRGAIVRPTRPAMSRKIGLLHRNGSLAPAADAFAKLEL